MYIYEFKFITKSQENTALHKTASSDDNCLVIQLINHLFAIQTAQQRRGQKSNYETSYET